MSKLGEVLDEIDTFLIFFLQEHGTRIKIKELQRLFQEKAKELKEPGLAISDTTIHNRLRKLQEKGVIEFSLIVNPKALGLETYLCQVIIEEEGFPLLEDNIYRVLEALRKNPFISDIYVPNRGNVIFALAHVSNDPKGLEVLRYSIKNQPGISKVGISKINIEKGCVSGISLNIPKIINERYNAASKFTWI